MSEVREQNHLGPDTKAVDRAVEKWLQKCGELEPDLLAVGVAQDLIAKARARAEERIRKEHEELERQDPVSVIEQALGEAAQTDEGDKLYLQYQHGLRGLRRNIKSEGYDDPRQLSRPLSPFYLKNETGDKLIPYVRANILSGTVAHDPETGKVAVQPSLRLIESFLKKMGALEEDQSLDNFIAANYRRYDDNSLIGANQERGPLPEPFVFHEVVNGREEERITNIPTKMDGVMISIERVNLYNKTPSIDVLLTPQALKKVRADV